MVSNEESNLRTLRRIACIHEQNETIKPTFIPEEEIYFDNEKMVTVRIYLLSMYARTQVLMVVYQQEE